MALRLIGEEHSVIYGLDSEGWVESVKHLEADDYVAIGNSPAQSGIIRIPYNQWIKARNSGDTADVSLIRHYASYAYIDGGTGLHLNNKNLAKAKLVQCLVAADALAAEGALKWDSTDKKLQTYDGTVWKTLQRQTANFEAHTADDTLTKEESGSVHTNLGAVAAVTLTLPQDATAGCRFKLGVMAAQQLRIGPGAAGAIYISGAKQADDKYIWADDEGESVELVADGNGDWVALFAVGVWGVEA